MIDDPECARFAVLEQDVMDMYTGNPGQLRPPLDPRIAQGWRLMGHLSARDAVLPRLGRLALGATVFYGVLLRSADDPADHVLVLRGTASLAEWVIDAEFAPVPHPLAGCAEDGFQRLAASLALCPSDGAPSPLALALEAVLRPTDGVLTVVGHSLGSAVATLAAVALKPFLKDRLRTRCLASPRVGNAAFCAAADALLGDYKVYNYSEDEVPKVPKDFTYSQLPRAIAVTPPESQAVIADSLWCKHHAISYAHMLNWDIGHAATLVRADREDFACALGRNVSGGLLINREHPA